MKLAFTWQPRIEPLQAAAVYIPAEKKTALFQRLLRLDDHALANLEGVISKQGIIIVAKESALPWVDGCLYLGMDKQSPHLYSSATQQPSLPIALLDKALYKKYKQVIAILPDASILIPLQNRKPLSRSRLQDYATT